MKNTVLILMMFITYLGFAQTSFDSLEDHDDVSTIVVTKDMFDLLKKFPDAKSKDMNFFNALKGLSNMKIFSTNNDARALKMEALVKNTVSSQKLTELLRTKDHGANTNVYVKSDGNKDIVNQVVIFMKNGHGKTPKSSIVSLNGTIDVNQLAEIAKKYNK